MMKYYFSMTLFLLIFSPSLLAQEQRQFYNRDKTQPFTASLKCYDFGKKMISLIGESGKTTHYSFDDLSEECLEYVLTRHDLRSDSGGVRLKFTDVKKKTGKYKLSHGFNVEITNQGKERMTSLTLNYTIYYEQGDLKKDESQRKVQQGVIFIKEIVGEGAFIAKTSKIDLVRIMLPPSVGCGGYYTPNGRRVDKMVGVVVDLVVDGSIVRIESSNAKLMMLRLGKDSDS